MKTSGHQSLLLIGALLLILGALLMSLPAFSQDEGFLYGKVYTEGNNVYEGPIRWGKEEIYWMDLFNASKERNENLNYLSDREKELLEESHYNWFSWNNNLFAGTRHWFGNNDHHHYIHQFSCQFGEIKTVKPMGKEYVEVELRNGRKLELSGEGYNDIGLNIKVADKALGEMEIHWGRIEKIEFLETPSTLDLKFGEPLYGTVEAFGDTFTGYIQWDHDERISTDKLDGDSGDGDVSVAFGKIRSIEKRGNRSLVTLTSGRELWLTGSNDVSSGHRGVIVMNKEFPAIDIPWSEFEKVVFEEKKRSAASVYSDYSRQKTLSGNVTTFDGKSLSGKIIYDLDESYDHELLQGQNGGFEFTTAFRNVKRITTWGSHRCTVELKSGKKITLDEGQDVSEKNQGVLVFSSDQANPSYIPWYEISEIEFR